MRKPVSPLRVGASVMIRTLTMHYTGKIAALSRDEVILTDAAWIASSGRWAAALTNGTLDEVEPYPDPVSINRNSIVDVTPWRHALPRETK